MAQVLVVDDEPKLGRVIKEALELDGHQVVRCGGGRQALVELAARRFEVVITDLKMPEVDGLDVLRECGKLRPAPVVIVMTAYGTAESAVNAMKSGAADYLVKPFALDELRLRVKRLAQSRESEEKSSRFAERLRPDLVAESPKMKKVMEAAKQVAATDATVLLLGESGTGKSQIARSIHYESARAALPFVEVHCAALPETLLESELFGHEKGAFTGADQRKQGHLSKAERGTLFLDEIGEVTPATQVKLLRFLQDREFVPLGSTEPRRVDARVITATNRDLEGAVKEGKFREDFFYRLNVFTIRVPPLAERREDILPIADRFLSRRGLPPAKLSPEARSLLATRSWPGNVRELENALERGLILAGEQEVQPLHLEIQTGGAGGRGEDPGDLLGEGFNLDAFNLSLIHAAIARAGGNKTAAARMLGVTRRRLYSLLESLGEKTHPTEEP